jgi:hypothetical protein
MRFLSSGIMFHRQLRPFQRLGRSKVPVHAAVWQGGQGLKISP